MTAVIFDMDGVIVDSESRHEEAFYDTVRAAGFGDQHGLEFSRYVGRSDRELWADFQAMHPTGPSAAVLLEQKTQRVIEILLRDRPVFAGLPELIKQLTPEYVLGLASGSERVIVDTVLEVSGLANFFQTVVACGDVQHGKPEPDIFLLAASRLNVRPEECWVIEDSKPGIQAGLKAGMKVIAIANTHPPEELTGAHYVVGSYSEIEALLLCEVGGAQRIAEEKKCP